MRFFAWLASLTVFLSGCMIVVIVDESTRPSATPSAAAVAIEAVQADLGIDATLAPRLPLLP